MSNRGFNRYEVREDYAIIFIESKGKIYECLVDLDTLVKLKDINKRIGMSFSSKRKGLYYANIKYWDGLFSQSWAIYVHRLALGLENASPRIKIDHIDGNGLDNRRTNLRAVSNSINMINRKNVQSNNTSGALRVDFIKHLNKYRARITVNKKEIHLGLFDDKEAAEKVVIEYREKVLSNVK